MDYHVWSAMFEAYCKLKTKSKTIAEVKEALRVIWGNLPQELIDETLNIKLYTPVSYTHLTLPTKRIV